MQEKKVESPKPSEILTNDDDIFQQPYLGDDINLEDYSRQEFHDYDADLFNEVKKKHKQIEWKFIHWVKLISILLVAIVATAIVFVYFCHLVFPDNWCWLSPERLEILKNSAISISTGLVVGIALSVLHDI